MDKILVDKINLTVKLFIAIIDLMLKLHIAQ